MDGMKIIWTSGSLYSVEKDCMFVDVYMQLGDDLKVATVSIADDGSIDPERHLLPAINALLAAFRDGAR